MNLLMSWPWPPYTRELKFGNVRRMFPGVSAVQRDYPAARGSAQAAPYGPSLAAPSSPVPGFPADPCFGGVVADGASSFRIVLSDPIRRRYRASLSVRL